MALQRAGKVFGVLLLVENLEVFICHFLDWFENGLLSFVIRKYERLLRVKEFGYK